MSGERRVRVLHQHDALQGTGTDDYHEWVEISVLNDSEMLDALGRRGNHGMYRWDRWVCNNPDCNAEALVKATAVEDIVRTWLPEAPS